MSAQPQSSGNPLLDPEVRSNLFDRIISDTSNGVVITDVHGDIVYVNPAFTAITGYRSDQALGKNMRMLHSGRQTKSFYETMWSGILSEGRWAGEIWNRRRNGECYREWISINAVRNAEAGTEYYVGIFSDISSIKSREHQLERLAFFDPLTGLPNRLLFKDRLRQAMARAERGENTVALCFLDLDGFKRINDEYGHLLGDQLLQEVAARLRKGVRKADTVARISGDEFMILLTSVSSLDDVKEVAGNLLRTVAEPYSFVEPAIDIFASLGISMYPRDGKDDKTLISHADLAMYAAKRDGGNCCRAYEEIHDRIPERSNISSL